MAVERFSRREVLGFGSSKGRGEFVPSFAVF